MFEHLRPALSLLAILSLMTGFAYPGAVTAIATLLFPDEARGSLIRIEGRAVGSSLIGQSFTADSLFWSRPSSTLRFAYDAAASSGSNLGPSNPALIDSVRTRIDRLRAAAARAGADDDESTYPADLVTASASGLDPHITIAAALAQIPRVARARSLSEAAIRRTVEARIEGRTFGLLGEPRVNVLMLNLDLERD